MRKVLFTFTLLIAAFLANAQSVLFHENFEPPSNADSVTTSGASNNFAINSRIAHGGIQCDSNFVQTSDTSYLTSNSFSTIGLSYVFLNFSHICKIQLLDAGEVQVSIDNGTSWVNLTGNEYINTNGSQFVSSGNKFNANSYPTLWDPLNNTTLPLNSWWKTETFNISAIAGNKANVMIRFALRDGNANGALYNAGWFIDDIVVTGALSELTPPTVNYKPPVLQDTIFNTGPFNVYAWIKDASGIDTAYISYQVNYGPNIYVPMIWISDSTYLGIIPQYTFNNRIDYFVHAVDNSASHNAVNGANKWFYIKKPASVVQIGTGTSTGYSYGPIYRSSSTSSYDYSKYFYVITASELAAAGVPAGVPITKLEWYKTDAYATTGNANFRIWMKNSSNTGYAGPTAWATLVSGATQVYNSTTQTIPATIGWIPFNITPFVYTGGAIEIGTDWDISAVSGNPSTGAFNFQYTTGLPSMYTIGIANSAAITGNLTNVTYGGSLRPNVKINYSIAGLHNDAGVTQIVNPSGTIVAGVNSPVNINIKNFGLDTLKKATIGWKVDGVIQSSYVWNGSLPEALTSSLINIGNVNVGLGSHSIKVWTTLPNDSTDNNHINDTATGTFFACSSILNGTYTIAPSGDFHSFGEALTALGNCGVNGPVVFQVASGTYTEQLNMPSINGISATNTVTFQSASGNNADVILQFAATATANNYVIKMEGSKYLTFKNMTMQANGTSFGTVIYYTNNAQYINFIGNKFKGVSTTATTSDLAVVYSPSSATNTDNYVSFTGNTILNGSYGIYLSGTGTAAAQLENGTIISNNTFTNQTLFGINLNYQNAPTVSGNNFTTTSANTSYNAIMLNYSDNNTQITKNLVTLSNGGYGVYVKYCDGVNGSAGLIANNAISIGGLNGSYGIYAENSSYQNIFYNSVNVYSNNTNANAMYIVGGTSYVQHRLKNNNFNYLGSNVNGKAYYVAAPAMVAASNYNNIYSTGTNVGYCGTNCTTLAAWKTNFARDTNSVSVNPAFVSNTNLHTFLSDLNGKGTPITYVTDDIEGNPRNATFPDIGAYEFNPPAKNMGMVSITQPQNSCALSAASVVTIKIKNFGSSTIDTTQVYYKVNGGTAVHETVIHSILPDSTYNYSFTQTVNLSTPGNYTFKAYLHTTGDTITLNDTINNYTIYSGYNFTAAPYTQSFEPTEYYADWSKIDVNADTYTWTYPNTGDAHTGGNSARLATGTTNPGNDWLFSRCFTMFTGNTYKIDFWYKVSSSSSPQIIELKVGDNNTVAAMTTSLQSLVSVANTNYLKATATFTPTTSGTYYFGWWGHSVPNSGYAFIDDINISIVPPQEAANEAVKTPNSACGLGNEPVTIHIKNTGANPIAGNLMAYYKVNNGTVVSEAVSNTIAAGDTINYTFTQPANLSVTTTDQIFTIKSWVALPGDPLAYNDTASKSVTSYHVPANPIVSNQTIPWGSYTTLTAVSPDTINWYNVATGGSPISANHSYTTPQLYNNTVYYAQALSLNSAGPVIYSNNTTSIGTGTTAVGYPFYTFYHDSRTQMIYTAAEIASAGGSMGSIYKIAFDVVSPAAQVMNGFKIEMQNTTQNNLTAFVETGWTTVYTGTYTVPATGWQEIILQTPFQYDGTSNLMINICFDNTSYTSNSTVNSTTAANKTWHQHQDNSTGCTFAAGSAQTTRPNIKLSINAQGCASPRIADTVFMSLFPYEAGITSMTQPVDGCIGTGAYVTIKVRNNGGNPITNIPAYYKINGSTPVAETITATIQPNDTLTYTFTTPILTSMSSSNQDSTYNIKAYIAHPSDPNPQNDTIIRSVNLLYTPPAPVVTSTTIPYGTSTVLHAVSSDSIKWWSAPVGGTLLSTSSHFTTPQLYTNTIYYAQAAAGSGLDSLFTTTAGGNGCSGGNMFDLYPLNGSLTITGFAISPYTSGALPVNVYIKSGTYVGSETNAAAWTLIGTYNLNPTAAYTLINLDCADFTIPAGQTTGVYLNFNASYTTLTAITDYTNSSLKLTAGAGLCGQFASANTPRGFNGKVYYGSGSGCASDRVADSVFINLLPIEASVVKIVSPSSGCSNNNEHITIKIRNNGSASISNFGVKYTVNGSTPVSETITSTILPGDTLAYTFFQTFNPGLTSTNVNGTFILTAYIELTGDPMQVNDTLHKTFELHYIPPVPVVTNINIPYGTSGTLNAVAADTVFWYSAPTGGNSLHTGLNYVTPTLYGTTVYYAEAAVFLPGVQSTIGTGTTTVGYPFYTIYHDSKTQMIYTAAEIATAGGGAGTIEKIAFNVSAADPAAMNGFTIQMQQTNASTLTGFVGTGWTTVYTGTYTVPGTGWQDIALQTPFFYDGVSNLLINICFDNSAYTLNSTVYSSAAAGKTWHQYSDYAVGCSFNVGSAQANRPNIRLTQSVKGCPSARVADTVFVSGVPPCDMTVLAITSPNTGTLLTASEIVKVKVKNQGTATATNIPISYKIGNLAPVNETIPGPLALGDTITYNFTTHANLSAYQTYQIKAYTGLTCDATNVNDTLVKTVTNNPLVYCTSIPSYTADEEIFSVTLNGATNAYDCSTVAPGPGSILNRYSNFMTLPPLTTLSMGIPASFSIHEDECDAGNFYQNGIGIWIDLNRDGDFTDPNEAVFIEPTTTVGPRNILGTITVPYGSFNGVTTMRIICAEGYSGTGLQPCMTYSYGETEDYAIRISPPIPKDAGAISFYQPTVYQDEGMNAPVQLIVKNFGTDTIKNSSNLHVYYQYASNPVQSVLWNGGVLPPYVTDTVTLPNFTVLAGNLPLCGWTTMPGDSNTFNDSTCSTLIGTPQHDAGVTTILSPGMQLVQGSSEIVSVVFKNFGADTITSLNLGYKLNGVVQTTEPWSGILLPGLSTTFTFTQQFPVPSNNFTLCAYTQLVNDAVHSNDTSCTNPFGVITSTLPFYDNFDGTTQTFSPQTTNALTAWELGTPAYGATNSAYSAPNSWDINLNATYTPSVTATLYTQYFDFSNAISAKMSFWRNNNVENSWDGCRIDYTIDTGATWQTLGIMNDPLGTNWYNDDVINSSSQPGWTSNSNGWIESTYKLSALNNVPVVRFRFVFSSDGSGQVDGFSIDDFSITIPSHIDAGVTTITDPIVQAQAGSTQVVSVKIKNFGIDTLYSIPVAYTINGGIPVTEIWSDTLAPDSTVVYNFSTPFIMPSGQTGLCAFTQLTGDGDLLNDTTCTTLMGVPTIAVPVSDDFEGSIYFFTSGPLWEYGTPTASTINTAHSPTHAWATNLDGDYPNNAEEYLYSPLYDFSTVDSAYLEFYHWYHSESANDGGSIQYSKDGGANWITLGILNDTLGTNWYNSTIGGAPYWSGNSNGWVMSSYALHKIPGNPIITSFTPVQFRFKFKSNATTNSFNGWAIDDINIVAPPIPNDAGVTAILQPTGSTQTGAQVTVGVTIKNYGTSPLTSTSVRYVTYVNGVAGAVTTETWNGNLAPNATTNYTFTNTYSSPGVTYNLCAFTVLAGDTYYWNDSTCTTLTTTPGAKDVGVIRILEPTDIYPSPIDTTIYNTPVHVKVTIKNYGFSTETSIPMVFLINGSQTGAGNWTGSLAPGDTVVYDFPTTYTSPLSFYQLCATTHLVGDVNTANDQLCKSMFGKDTASSIDELDGSGFGLLQNQPNPCVDKTEIVYFVPSDGSVVIEFTDLLGNIISRKEMDAISGKNTYEYNVRNLADGVYFYTLNYKDKKITRRMVVAK